MGYAATAVIRAEPTPVEGHRASTFGWWDFVLSIPAPRVVVVHDLDDPRGLGAQFGEVNATIHRALGCVGLITDGSPRDLDEVRALGFQLFGRTTSRSATPTSTWSTSACPVKLAGVGSSPAT